MKKLFMVLIALLMVFTVCGPLTDGGEKTKNPDTSVSSNDPDRGKVENDKKVNKNSVKISDKKDLDMTKYEEAVIIRCEENEILTYKKDNMGYLVFVNIANSKIYIDDKESSKDKLEQGMTVKLDYSGPILESYPAQMSADYVFASSLIPSTVNDKVGFYVKVIEDIWKEDTALQADTKYLGLDIDNGPVKLDKYEKEALSYILMSKYDKEILFTSIEQLEKEGKIKDLSWKDGVMIILKDKEGKESKDYRHFTLEKWRSGTGAIIFSSVHAYWDKEGKLEKIDYQDASIS